MLRLKKKSGVILGIVLLCFSMVIPAWGATKTTVDPSEIGVGARNLGVGRAMVGFVDDVNSVFANPAGLAWINHWQLTSMYAKLLGEVDYTLIGGANPTKFGNFGIGYIGSTIGDSQATRRDPNTGRIIVDTGSYSYTNSVIMLGYGRHMSTVFSHPFWKDIAVGATFKIFNQGISGTAEGMASGYNMDLGAQWRPLKYVTVGFLQRNAIPAAWGGQLHWATGTDENMPSKTLLGLVVNVWGDEGLYQFNDYVLRLSMDTEFNLTRANRPTLIRIGSEWWPNDILALRLGIDQAAVAVGSNTIGISNDLTAGVGILYRGFRFDYAYHAYTDLVENNTHYFSLSYVGMPETETTAEYIAVDEPADQGTVYKDAVMIAGEVRMKDVAEVRIGGEKVEVGTDHTFRTEYALPKYGKNLLVVTAHAADGKVLETKNIRLRYLSSYSDVTEDFWAKQQIEQLATLGLIQGYPDGTFRPNGGITRSELTALLVRAKGLELPVLKDAPFNDVKKSNWAARYIKAGVAAKMVAGYPGNLFKPTQKSNRVEGIIVTARFGEVAEPPEVKENPFPDFPSSHWAARTIAGAKNAGLLQYLNGKNLDAKKYFSRAEAVEVLSKTEYVGKKIEALMDWEKGFEGEESNK